VAKSTKGGGPSFTPEELADTDGPPPVRIRRAELGVVDQCRPGGKSSSESAQKAQQSDEPTNVPPPALTTENPSSKTDQDSGAPSTDGDIPLTDQESPESTEDEIPPYSEWHKDDLKEECRSRGLAVSGTVAELVARLEEYDAATG